MTEPPKHSESPTKPTPKSRRKTNRRKKSSARSKKKWNTKTGNEMNERHARVLINGAAVALGIACVAFPPLGFVVLCMWWQNRKLKQKETQ